MTQKEKAKYMETDKLREILQSIKGCKFQLDCGHHITMGHNLGNDLTIYNGKTLKIICSQCGY